MLWLPSASLHISLTLPASSWWAVFLTYPNGTGMKDERKHLVGNPMKPTVVVRHVIIAFVKGEDIDISRERKQTSQGIVQGNGQQKDVCWRTEMFLKENNSNQGIQDNGDDDNQWCTDPLKDDVVEGWTSTRIEGIPSETIWSWTDTVDFVGRWKCLIGCDEHVFEIHGEEQIDRMIGETGVKPSSKEKMRLRWQRRIDKIQQCLKRRQETIDVVLFVELVFSSACMMDVAYLFSFSLVKLAIVSQIDKQSELDQV